LQYLELYKATLTNKNETGGEIKHSVKIQMDNGKIILNINVLERLFCFFSPLKLLNSNV